MLEKILSYAGNVASLISLGVSIYVAFSLRKIKNSYIFRVRAPGFERALRNHAKALTEYGNDFANFTYEIANELEKADVKLRAMHGRMRGESKKAVGELRRLISAYGQTPADERQFRVVYRKMQRVIEEVKEFQEDLDLE